MQGALFYWANWPRHSPVLARSFFTTHTRGSHGMVITTTLVSPTQQKKKQHRYLVYVGITLLLIYTIRKRRKLSKIKANAIVLVSSPYSYCSEQRHCPWGPPSFLFKGWLGLLSPGVKRKVPEENYSASSADVGNVQRFASTPQYNFKTCTRKNWRCRVLIFCFPSTITNKPAHICQRLQNTSI